MLVVFIVAGLALGAILAGATGAILGTLLGMVAGLLMTSSRKAVHDLPPGTGFRREQHELLCVPKGQVARTTFVRSNETGDFLDVESCSLCTPEDHVRCSKRCLFLMRDDIPKLRPTWFQRKATASPS